MGLENGIIVIPKSIRAKRFCKEFFSNYKEEAYRYEICYWRKYWSLNNEILECLGKKFDLEETKFNLTLENLKGIVDILKRDISYDYYENNVRCLWEYPIYARNLGNNIFELSNLIDELENEEYEENDIKIYYYNAF